MKRDTIKQALAALPPRNIVEADYAAKGFHLDVTVAPEQVAEAAAILDQEEFFIEAITGVDWLGEKEALRKAAEKARQAAAKAAEKAAAEAAAEAGGEAGAAQAPEAPAEQAPPEAEEPSEPEEDELEVVYDFNHYEELCRVTVRTRVPRSNPELPTISAVYPGADWHERETHDFFGIRFAGHPHLVPLLLPEDADYHPLLKDFHV